MTLRSCQERKYSRIEYLDERQSGSFALHRTSPHSRWANDRHHGRLIPSNPRRKRKSDSCTSASAVAGAYGDSCGTNRLAMASTRWSKLPRWKFTDSCGRPRVPGAIHFGCAHDFHTCPRATRREFLKGGHASRRHPADRYHDRAHTPSDGSASITARGELPGLAQCLHHLAEAVNIVPVVEYAIRPRGARCRDRTVSPQSRLNRPQQ